MTMGTTDRDETSTGYPPLTPEAVRALLQTMTPDQLASAFVDATLTSAAQVTGHDCQWWSAAGLAGVIAFFRLDTAPWPQEGRQIGYFLACVPHRRGEPGAGDFLAAVHDDVAGLGLPGAQVEVLFQGEYRD
jgi:hypothetical protein